MATGDDISPNLTPKFKYIAWYCSYLEEEGVLDDNPEGWDIGYRDSKSHFSSLLNGNNESLLNDFVNDCEKIDRLRNNSTKRRRQNSLHDEYVSSEDDDVNDPEYAFLSISQNLRHALKKHLPLVNRVNI